MRGAAVPVENDGQPKLENDQHFSGASRLKLEKFHAAVLLPLQANCNDVLKPDDMENTENVMVTLV